MLNSVKENLKSQSTLGSLSKISESFKDNSQTINSNNKIAMKQNGKHSNDDMKVLSFDENEEKDKSFSQNNERSNSFEDDIYSDSGEII